MYPRSRSFSSRFASFFFVLFCIAALASSNAQSQSSAAAGPPPNYRFPHTYTNPLTLQLTDGSPAVSCPDPAIFRYRNHDGDTWYLYCTGDPLNSSDVDANGNLRLHLITQYRSYDLIHWSYIGDAFQHTPAWVGNATAQFWAPAVKQLNGKYYMYYVAPNTPGGGAAIGVATSSSPAGPWTDSGAPAVASEAAFCCAGSKRAVIDPDVIADDSGQLYISYGSFFGGISVRKLSADGLTSDASSETLVGIDNFGEGASFWKHNGYYYLFFSTAGCCDGPLSGYTVLVGRARSPMGPFFDKNGAALTSFAPGGTFAMAANGNRWVGPGGNVLFQDDSGQDYMLYHAVDQQAPYFAGFPGVTRRPALIDPVDWVNDWPVVRGGYYASATRQPAPAAQPIQYNQYRPRFQPVDQAGKLIPELSDDFNTSTLSSQWHFIHPQANNTYTLTGNAYEVQTQGPDENGSPASVAILGEPVPATDDWMVETKVTSSVPFDNSCCYNFAQGALFIYGNDLNSIKLDLVSIFDTRQTEFGKQIGPVPQNYPTYDHQVAGQAARTTWLRIVKHSNGNAGELYTAYSSTDGEHWTKGGTWQHALGSGARIGISAENAAGFTMDFDYVHVYRLKGSSSGR
ncbi:MAG: family 43 glycosylhydrolase [Acidobacteriaceae bacterium]